MSHEISTQQQTAWLALAAKKNNITTDLQNAELALQSILIDVADDQIDAKLKSYRLQWDAMSDMRKGFTSIITDKLITPLMEFEKRCDPRNSQLYIALQQKSLDIRLKDEADKKKTANIIMEKKAFEVFVRNNYEQQCLEYRKLMYHEIMQNGLDAELSLVKVPEMPKFVPKFITRDEMVEIFATIPKPDYSRILAEMDQEKNNITPQADIVQIIANAEIEAADNQRVNTRIATQIVAEVLKPKVKRKLALTADSDNWQQIVAAFSNGLYLPFVKVKDIGKLTVQQMATALADHATETGTLVDGLNYSEIVK